MLTIFSVLQGVTIFSRPHKLIVLTRNESSSNLISSEIDGSSTFSNYKTQLENVKKKKEWWEYAKHVEESVRPRSLIVDSHISTKNFWQRRPPFMLNFGDH